MDALHKNTEVLGSVNKDLILNTFGKIYVRVRDKYYELNYNNFNINDDSKNNSNSDIIILESSNDLYDITYPGDKKIIITLDGGFYITNDGKYNLFNIKQTSNSWELTNLTVKNPITVLTTSEPPFIINSNKLVKNLNSQYLNGYKDTDFAKKNVDENIKGNWTIKNILYIDNTLQSTSNRQSLNNTILDFNNSSLDIDYINVRKALRVYEYIINRIKCTNGSFWVSDSAIVQYKYNTNIDVDKSSPSLWSYTIIDAINDDYNFGALNNDWHTLEEWYSIFIPNYIDKNSNIPIDINNEVEINNATTLLTGRNTEGIIVNENLWNKTKELYPDRYETLTIKDFFDTLYNGFYNISGVSNKYSGSIITCTMKDETSAKLTVFWVNDVVMCQKVIGYASYNIEGVVTKVDGSTVYLKLSDQSVGTIEDGDTLVRIDNVINPDRRGAVYMTSSDYKSPYIDVIDNTEYSYSKDLNNIDDKNQPYINNSNIKIRLGRLDGLAYDEVFGRMSGIGIFIKGSYNKDYIPKATTIIEQIEEFAKNNSGGLYIKDGCIALGSYTNTDRKVGILLNNDGSGYLAQGHIYWNKEGTLYLDGGDNQGLIILNGDIKLGPNENGTYKIELKNDGSAKFGNGTTIFKSDGSGQLANGNIKWTVNNELTIQDANVAIGKRPAWLFSTDQKIWYSKWNSATRYALDYNNQIITIGGRDILEDGLSLNWTSQYKTPSDTVYKDFSDIQEDYITASSVTIKNKYETSSSTFGGIPTGEYTSIPSVGVNFNKDGSGSIAFNEFSWDNSGRMLSKSEIFNPNIIFWNGGVLNINKILNVEISAVNGFPSIVILPEGKEYVGKTVRLYVSSPATMSVGTVYVYNKSQSSQNLLIEFNGGYTGTPKVYEFECQYVANLSNLTNYNTKWVYLDNTKSISSGVLYSGHATIPANTSSDPFGCNITQYVAASGINVSSITYQYQNNPLVNLDGNWVGYIYHNIGHTNYSLTMTTIPYNFWPNKPDAGANINDAICRILRKETYVCVFQINRTDGSNTFQEFDFVICGELNK